jgi:Rieske Fe-S protein
MSISRRRFLQRSAIAVGSLKLAGCGNPVDAPPLYHATVAWLPTDANPGTVRLQLAAISDLALVGGAVTVKLDDDPFPSIDKPFKMPNGGALLVVHRGQIGSADEFIAVDSGCPHASCPLGYSAASDLIECPCHSSRFRAAAAGARTCVGQKMHGPTRQDVLAYQAALDPKDLGTLIIDLNIVDDCAVQPLPAIVGGTVTLTTTDYPELKTVGGGIVGRPARSPKGIAIARVSAANDASAIVAVSATCPHRGCTVAFADGTSCGPVAGGGFCCPCHGSTFKLDGTLMQGPANQSLPKYSVAFDGTTLTIRIV